MSAAPSQSEGDVNRTPLRAAWQQERLDAASRALLARDSAAFLHQSVSTPCLAPIVKAEGLYIEDLAGRRYLDFHGNNVHHLGHGHPEVIAAIKAQLDELSFAPRRFASERPTCPVQQSLFSAAKLAGNKTSRRTNSSSYQRFRKRLFGGLGFR